MMDGETERRKCREMERGVERRGNAVERKGGVRRSAEVNEFMVRGAR